MASSMAYRDLDDGTGFHTMYTCRRLRIICEITVRFFCATTFILKQPWRV
jgi:hypothetical protein